MGNATLVDELFAFIYTMPPLKEREEDVEYLKTLFVKEACETLMIEENKVDMQSLPLNLTMNSKSLKKSLYLDLMKLSMDEKEMATGSILDSMKNLSSKQV
jgi:transcriptional regulator of aromatic amino acid metabolism